MKTRHPLLRLLLVTWLCALVPLAIDASTRQDAPTDAAALIERAEALFAEGSHARALELYEEASKLELDEGQARWVRMRSADARWRSASASERADRTELERAEKELRAIVAEGAREEDRDRVWAEAQESLGDFAWLRDEMRNFGQAWQSYAAALEYWARSSDLELAREHYLAIVDRAARPAWYDRRWGYGAYGNAIPRDVIQNVLKIAADDAWRARAHYMLGLSYAGEGRTRRAALALEELEKTMAFGTPQEAGAAGEWYDDALYQSALLLETTGRLERDEQGNEVWKEDFVGAAERYRRLLKELGPGESRYRHEATQRLRGITAPSLSLSVERFFLPGSEVPYALAWRNLERVELALYPFDLTSHVAPNPERSRDWLQSVPLDLLEPSARWTHETGDTGEHRPDRATLYLEEKPALGAYVLRASAGGQDVRALVLVSDVALTVKATGRTLLAWLTDVRSGEPRGGASLHLWQRYHDGSSWRRRELEATTEPDGTRRFTLEASSSSSIEYFLAARAGDAQAFVQGNGWSRDAGVRGWRTYAYTDRPAYRPGDRVQWKLVARDAEAEGYRTPAGETVAWEVRDPQGNVVAKGEGELNAFGTLWGSLETNADMPLGEFQVSFERVTPRRRDSIGQATLFRLEEYKLPEYEVTVETAKDDDGQVRVFVLGDEVAFDVEGSYYFGGPVAGAEVEVFVYQRPYWRWIPKHREYPWLYQGLDQGRQWWGGPGQQILHQKLRTDAAGRARLSFETPLGGNQDLEYTIEARLVDASRREVVGRQSVRVTRTEYEVQLSTEHTVHRPNDPVELSVRAVDANDAPVAVEGRLRVQRERWIEVWTDPGGRKVMGEELDRLRRDGLLPPPGGQGGRGGWQQVFAGYEQETVAETTLRTDAEGEARWSVRLPREGHYRIAWNSYDGRGTPIEAETRVFVADESTVDLGVRSGGIDLVLDKDTFVEGEEAAFMLLAEGSGRWVLFTVEAGELLHHEVVHLEGTAKLMRLPIDASHVPNVWLAATTVFGGRTFRDQEQVVVPPVKHFLDVQASFDQPAFEPGSEGQLHVVVRDHAGEPVATELSFGVWDAALAYIQEDYARDPRQFFYGELRGLSVNTRSSFDMGGFADLERKEEDGDRSAFRQDDERRGGLRALGYGDNFMAESEEMPAAKSAQMADAAGRGAAAPAPAEGGAAPVLRVRSDFRDTALWLPDVTTGADGTATVTVPFPDSTTRWKAVVRAVDAGADVGQGEASARTRLPLIARLQTPRFFQVGDECLVSANLNNNTDGALQARVTLAVDGLALLGRLVGDALVDPGQPILVDVPANGSVRVDWRVRAERPGSAAFELAALAGELGDALRRDLPVLPHGIDALIARGGKLRGDELALTVELPPRAPGSTRFDVQLTPSLAVTMLDALPYLVDYPYGCTEQTLSRFLPSAIVAGTLRDLGLSPADAMQRVFGGVEGEWSSKTHPAGKKPLDELDQMTAQGLARLYDFQHSDGGWGWWKGGDSDPYMTAYVVWGLSLGRDAGLDVREGVLEGGARWLALHLVELEDQPDLAAWSLHALAAFGRPIPQQGADAFVAKAFERLWSRRESLNAYTRALFTLAAVGFDRLDQARVLARNLSDGAVIDRTPDTSMVQRGGGASQPFVLATVHWGEERSWWRWSDGAVESTAFVLRALLAVDPANELVEPAMNWLVKNRRGAQWSNTRDTAICVLALNDWLRKSGELEARGSFELLVNGERVSELRVTPETVLRAPSVVRVDDALLRDGENQVVLRRTDGGEGTGALYFAVQARFFSLEEPIPARGNEVFVRRDYYKLVGRPTLLAGTLFERVPLRDGESVASGQRIEVVLTVESKNDLEYMLFEDHKPAGFEAVGVKSGEPFFARELRRDAAEARFANEDAAEAQRRRAGRDRDGLTPDTGGPSDGTTGRTRWAHQELREAKVAVFLDQLPQGFWEMRYDLRAEVPGTFHALPLEAHAMYVPEIQANGAEQRVTVLERGE